MGKCDKCRYYDENSDCKECNPDYRVTNADKIRSMSDEELAEFINWGVPDCSNFCSDFEQGCSSHCKHNFGNDVLLEWLQSEAE